MLGMIARRLLSLIPVLLVVTFVVFMLAELVPGDAAQSLAGGANATPEKIAEVRDGPGPRPPGARALRRLARRRGAARLRQVVPELQQRGRARRRRGARGADPGVGLAGAGGPVRRHRHRHPARHPRRHAPRAAWSTGRASPAPASGSRSPTSCSRFFLIQVFALSLGWFPAQGYTKFSEDPSAWLESIILPAFALGVIAAASVARQTRAALIDVLQSNYVRTAFAVGTGTRRTVGEVRVQERVDPDRHRHRPATRRV